MRSKLPLALSLVVTALGTATPTLTAQTPVEGTAYVETSDFGRVPREIVWRKDGKRMVLVPAGEYRLGEPGTEVSVTLGSYYIDVTEVTWGEFSDFTKRSNAGLPRTEAKAAMTGPAFPVVSASIINAREYAEGNAKDLPTEAEWEAAARGPAGSLYPWGDAPREGAAALGRGIAGITDPVGTNAADKSAVGAMDMAGNVSEWVKDSFRSDFYSAVAGQDTPLVEDGDNHVVRGGNYYDKTDGRATQRRPALASETREEVGFRTVFRLRKAPTATPTPVPVVTATPTPGPKDVFESSRERLLGMFRNPTGAPETPDAKATRLSLLNLTPHAATLGIFDPGSGKLAAFPTDAAANSSVEMAVPAGGVMYLLGYSKDSGYDQLVNLGAVSAVTASLVILQPHTFNPVVASDGSTKEPALEGVAFQHYEKDFGPQWNAVTTHNQLPVAVEVTVQQLGKEDRIEKTESLVISSGASAMFTDFGAVPLRVTAKYVGSKDDVTSTELKFENDGSVHNRILYLSESPDSEKVFRVLTREMKEIVIQPSHFVLPPNVVSKFVRDGALPRARRGR